MTTTVIDRDEMRVGDNNIVLQHVDDDSEERLILTIFSDRASTRFVFRITDSEAKECVYEPSLSNAELPIIDAVGVLLTSGYTVTNSPIHGTNDDWEVFTMATELMGEIRRQDELASRTQIEQLLLTRIVRDMDVLDMLHEFEEYFGEERTKKVIELTMEQHDDYDADDLETLHGRSPEEYQNFLLEMKQFVPQEEWMGFKEAHDDLLTR